jgi:hypothetical protein
MAGTAGILRTIYIPYAPGSTIDEVSIQANIATAIANPANVIIPDITWSYITYLAFNGSIFVQQDAIKVEMFNTVAGDALIVANLNTLATTLGITPPLPTTSEAFTYGY